MATVREWLTDRVGLSPAVQTHLLVTIIVIAGLWVLDRLVLAVVYRRVTDPWTRYHWRKSVTYLFLAIGVLVIGREWLEGFKSLATFLGLVSAGIAIALKDPLANLAGWAFIVWSRPFEVGDRIEIAKHKGDVIDVHLFKFTLNEIGGWVDAEQSTGRIVHVPNQQVFTEALANYDKGFKYIWNEVPVVVTYESNWKKAKEILTGIAFKHAEHLTAEAERDLLAASLEPRRRRGTVSAIWDDILTEFGKSKDIELAYHTVRSYSNPIEGKIVGTPEQPA